MQGANNRAAVCLGTPCFLLSFSVRLCPCALTVVPLVGRARAIHPRPVDTPPSSELTSRCCLEYAVDPLYLRDRVLGLSLLAEEEKAKLNTLAQLQLFASAPMQLPVALLCLEGVPGLPGAPQDEASLTRKFEIKGH